MPSIKTQTGLRKPGRSLALGLGATAIAAALFAMSSTFSNAAEEAVVIPPPAIDETASATTEKAVFAGGCFWGVQGVFQHVKGVKNAVSGYSGGTKETAVYETVSNGNTGHAETVEITYNPKEVTYGQLLQIFFSVAHNPTQLNYQGPDHGTHIARKSSPPMASRRRSRKAISPNSTRRRFSANPSSPRSRI